MIFIFHDSFSLQFMVIREDISIMINEDESSSSKRYTERNIYYKHLTYIEPIDEKEERKYFMPLIIIVLGLLTTFFSWINYILFVMLFTGYSCYYFVFNLIFTWFLVRLWSNIQIYRHHFVALIFLFIGSMLEIGFNLENFLIFFILFDKEYWKFGLVF